MFALEDAFFNIAKSAGGKCILLCDRGAMDAAAYMDAESWQRLIEDFNDSKVGIRDGRYDCVIHLMTAAEGAEKFYGNDTNLARLETAEEARAIDKRIREAWVGHPYLNVVDNSSDFEGKVAKVLEVVLKRIGERAPGRQKRKFLVSRFIAEDKNIPVKHETYDVEHVYLISDDATQMRLRRRGQNGVNTYSLTTRYQDMHGQRLELKRELNTREYSSLRLQADRRRVIVKKTRHSFLYMNRYYELDEYIDPQHGLMLLESYMSTEEQFELPDFISIEKEVTGDPTYSMFFLALLDNK